jgi:hypothetical protein
MSDKHVGMQACLLFLSSGCACRGHEASGAVNDICRVDGRPQQAGAQGTQQGRQDVRGPTGGDGADVDPDGTSQVLSYPQCAHGASLAALSHATALISSCWTPVFATLTNSLSLFKGSEPSGNAAPCGKQGQGQD